jgi:type II restriction enzyme
MDTTVITQEDIAKRAYWIEEIIRLSGNFGVDSERVEQEIAQEIQANGMVPLIGHLRLCGAIPEAYGHDSSEEKLYSKYTDVVIHEAYSAMGFTSLVLRERADVADVECVCNDYSFVADAKAFRLSRTAKNQKDFKVQAMDNWKHGKPFAMVVCPAYQLPAQTSQIYEQAAARSVCICTYTHLAVLVRYAQQVGKPRAIALMHDVFRTVEALNPSKSAAAYWQAVNRSFLDSDRCIGSIWREEKMASLESIQTAREEALRFLASERERIMRLSREDAIREVIKWRKIESRIRAVESVADNGLLGF